jgi:uncharacterized protein (DUF1810 family)
MKDRFDFQRFLDAQAGVYDEVRAELTAGRKRTHWMWFIFPQIAGLGRSEMARRYSLSSLEEAKAYLAHPLLGARLRECAALVNETQGSSVDEIFGEPDNMKFHSSMTLFARAAGGGVFDVALKKYFGGALDRLTLDKVNPTPRTP